jgi:hypothetical protein
VGEAELHSGIKTADGTYEHWGLARIHGSVAAEETIGAVHSELALQLLQTPIQELMEQLQISAGYGGMSVKQLADTLYETEKVNRPRDMKGGSFKHFHSVLLAAQLLSSENGEVRGNRK